jgi:hypothetical protein
MEKTAVEWFVERIESDKVYDFYKLVQEAKEIEQQQILNAAMWMPKPFSSIEFIPELAKQYYNDKYGDM